MSKALQFDNILRDDKTPKDLDRLHQLLLDFDDTGFFMIKFDDDSEIAILLEDGFLSFTAVYLDDLDSVVH